MLNHEQIRQFQPKPDCLQGKNILVTGAGDGIGKAVALAYAKYGATVLLMGKTQSKLEAVYDEIEKNGGVEPAILPMDLEKAQYSQMQELALIIEKEIGNLDGILHNAGILGALTPLEMYDPITFEQVMKVNFTAPFMLTQAFFPLLLGASSASVIFTSSGVAKPRAFWGAYALSKQGIEGMSDLFTQETQKTTCLRFNCINPGATRTQMRATAFPSENPNSLKAPEELLNAYIALMSDETIDIKGQVIDLQPKS